MRYIFLCMAVLICIAPTSAGLLDILNGPTTGIDWDKTTITDAIRNIPADDYATRQERINQGIAAKVKKTGFPIAVSVSKNNPLAVNLSPLGDYYIRIDKAEYEPSTGMLKTYIYATRNGRELNIKNPVRFYGMGYTYAPDPGAANIDTGKRDDKGNPIWEAYEEENPRLSLLTSIYSYLQTLDYGKIINDGSDPTVVYYPERDGSPYRYEASGIDYLNIYQNQSGYSVATSPLYSKLVSHSTRIYNYTYLYRSVFEFNLTTFNCNTTISSTGFYFYIYNTSPTQDYYFNPSGAGYLHGSWMKTITSVSSNDYDNFRPASYIASNFSVTNVTGLYTMMPLISPNTDTSKKQYFFVMLRHAVDYLGGPTRFSLGKTQGWSIYSVTYAGTSYDPFLKLEYTVTDVCPATTTCPTVTTTPCAVGESEVAGEPGIISGIFLAVNEMTGGTITGIYNTLDYQPFLIIALIILGYAVLRRSGK